MRVIRSPLGFLRGRDFKVVFGVYAGTYLAANASETIGAAFHSTSALPKFVGITLCNVFLCVRKDIIFSRLYGAPQGAGGYYKDFPLASVGLFLARDGLTIASAFNLPPLLANILVRWAENTTDALDGPESEVLVSRGGQEKLRHTQKQLQHQSPRHQSHYHGTQEDGHQPNELQDGKQRTSVPQSAGAFPDGSLRASLSRGPLWALRRWILTEPLAASSMAQVLSPVGIQLVSTPLHLLSLDLYHRPTATFGQRLSALSWAYCPAVIARAARIVPAFGVGGLVNSRTRNSLTAADGETAVTCTLSKTTQYK
ncbi:hypothetical protein cyc_03470 [Cyclospora cayetanensis]|nr:hypothetical protein cyc_03470 [Cyclospora cayetanensis]